MFNGKSQFVTSQNFQNVTGKSQLSQLFLVLFACLSHINMAFITYARHNIYLSVITMNSIILQFVKKRNHHLMQHNPTKH